MRKRRHRAVKPLAPSHTATKQRSRITNQLSQRHSAHFLAFSCILADGRAEAQEPQDKGDNGTELLGPLRVWGHPTRPPQTPGSLTERCTAGHRVWKFQGKTSSTPTIPPWRQPCDRRGRWSLSDANFLALNQNISTMVLGGPSPGVCGTAAPCPTA